MILQQFHVTEESAPGMAALDQVMAENPVVGEPGTHGGVKCLDVVDGLADELALSEQVLVNVGDLAGIGVQADISRKQAGEARSLRLGQRDSQPRLEDAVAPRHALVLHIDVRAVQRMRHGGGHFPGGLRRQLGVGIQHDTVLNAAQLGNASFDQRKGFGHARQHQPVEVLDLAALPLMPHPSPLARIPQAWPVQEVECRLAGPRVLGVQLADSRQRTIKQPLVFGHLLLDGVGQVGQEDHQKVGAPVAQVAQFKMFQQLIDRGRGREHRRDDDRGAMGRGDAFGEVQPRQSPRQHQQAHPPVHQ